MTRQRTPRRGASQPKYEPLEPRQLLSASLVADINAQPGGGFPPYQLASAGPVAYFFDHDGTHGAELWKTDGTPAGTSMVKDIWPGPAGSWGGNFVTIGATTYFTVDDGTHGNELWRTDGTAEGTVQVADINPGHANSNPNSLTASGSLLYFTADDGAHGRELWRSDGTAAGTHLVKDVDPGTAGQSANGTLCALPDGTVLFESTDGGTGTGLWRTDGTAAGTTFVVNPSGYRRVYNLTPSGGRAYFTDNLGYVWATDGTAAGTRTVDPTNSTASGFRDVAGTLYYVRGGAVKGVRAADTTAFTVLSSGGYTGVPSLADVDGTLYFSAQDQTTFKPAIFRVTGGSGAAGLVQSGFAYYPTNLTNVDGTLYFSVTDPSTKATTLWASAGTAATTTAVAVINTASTGSTPSAFTEVGSRLVFDNYDPLHGAELWSSDGTAAGTGLVRDVYPGTASSYADPMAVLGSSAILLQADDGVHGPELWRSDGTQGGTTLVKDISPGPGGSVPGAFTVTGSLAYFRAGDGTHGYELWVTDGTAAGTVMVKDINPGPGGSDPSTGVVLNGILYFTSDDGTHGSELWRSDGTDAGTYMVTDIYAGSADGLAYGAPMAVLNGALYFPASDGADGTELWRSDGTAAGTVLVKDIYPGYAPSSPASLVSVNGAIYFSANVPGVGAELWKSDGTAAGTVMVKDINPGYPGSSPLSLTAFGGLVYFAANDGTHGKELWQSDGTAAGTVIAADANPGSADGAPARLSVAGGELFFPVTGASGHAELWKVAGSGQAPQFVQQLSTVAGAEYRSPAAIDGRLYFLNDDGASFSDESHGMELWTSDGTAAGTFMMQDLWPGWTNGVGSWPVGFRGAIYVEGNDSVSGSELYRFEQPIPPAVQQSTLTMTDHPQLSFTFNKDVSASLDPGDLVLTDQITGQVTHYTLTCTYDPQTNTATFGFPAGGSSPLPSGVYRATLPSAALTDSDGRPMATDVTFDFLYVAPSDRYVLPATPVPVRVQDLAIGPTATLDLNDRPLVVDYTGASPLARLRQYLYAGRNGGSWDGTDGITSSAAANDPTHRSAIGYAEATSLGVTSWAGLSVDATAVLLTGAITGDANLDGRLTGDDFALADRGRARNLSSWVAGDFDYDAHVTDADLALLTQSFAAATAPAAATEPVEPVICTVIPVAPVEPTTVSATAVAPTNPAPDEASPSPTSKVHQHRHKTAFKKVKRPKKYVASPQNRSTPLPFSQSPITFHSHQPTADLIYQLLSRAWRLW